jgi:hypothetical protein
MPKVRPRADFILIRDRQPCAVLSSVLPGRVAPETLQGWGGPQSDGLSTSRDQRATKRIVGCAEEEPCVLRVEWILGVVSDPAGRLLRLGR